MFLQKKRRFLLVLLWIFIPIVFVNALVIPKTEEFTRFSSSLPTTTSFTESTEALPLFMTIIEGADEESICPNDGSTLAKFFLCGPNDIRTLTLNQSGTTYEWEMLDPSSCAASVNADCPNLNSMCEWNVVSTDATYNLASEGEFRVRIDNGPFFYLRASSNPLNPELIGEDIICGSPGRIEITNVPANYEYSLDGPEGPFQTDPFYTIDTPGTYQVWTRLQNAPEGTCIFPSNEVVIQDLDISVDVVAGDIGCSGDFGSITVTVSGVPGFYSFRLIQDGVTVDIFGPNELNSHVFENLAAGSYTVEATTNSCAVTIVDDVDGNPIEIGAGVNALDVTASATESFGCGATEVEVNLTTTGGTSPYRYSLDGGVTFSEPFASSTTFLVNAAGSYTVLVEDTNGCQRTGTAEVFDIPPPVFTLMGSDANCGGANDGEIVVNVTNSFGYTIEYSADNGLTYQLGNVFSGLAPNTYDIIVRYQQDTFVCTTPPSSTTIGTPSNIEGMATADSEPTCANETGGQISIFGVTGGASPYEYSIGATFGANPVFSNLGVGTYTPLVRDANGCIHVLPEIVFSVLDPPNDLDFNISALDCLSTTATVDLTPTGGIAPFTYDIVSPAANSISNGTNPSFSNLGLGTYTFRVTDAQGCSYEESFALTNISSIGAQAQQTQMVTCVGDSDGEGHFLVDGFNNTYSYSIDGAAILTGQTDALIPLTGLAAGSYTIEVTDEETNCTNTATLTIEEPDSPLAIALEVTPMDCQNGNVGSLIINATGGWGGNRYAIVFPGGTILGPQNSPTFPDLFEEGIYTASVRDANGCVQVASFTLSAVETPILSLDPSSDLCFDNMDEATLVVGATLGAAPYQYNIDNGVFADVNTFSGLTPGDYTLGVQDANGCTDSITVTIAPQIVPVATILQQLDCAGTPAEIEVTITGGYPVGGDYDFYEVSINGNPFTTDTNPIAGDTFVFSVPNDGFITSDTIFQFEVTDSEGCTNVTNRVFINPPEMIRGRAIGSDIVCGAANSGTVQIIPDANQGVPPFEYSEDGGATFGPQNTFTGYGPGTFGNFLIRDSRGCVSELLTATVTGTLAVDATVVSIDAQCTSGTVQGAVEVTSVANGTADFTYTLVDINGTVVATVGPTPNTVITFPNLPQGVYTVITQDSGDCEDRDTVTISQNVLDLTPLDPPPTICVDTFTSFRVQASGGVGPYSFRLVGDPGPLELANENGFDIHNFMDQISFGVTYFVEVEDSTGCRYIEEIGPIEAPNPITVTTSTVSASCGPIANGEILYEVDGLPSPANLTIRLENTDTGAIIAGPTVFNNVTIPYANAFTGLPSGNYQIIVQDGASLCEGEILVTLLQDAPSIFVDTNIPATCSAEALVGVRGSGGTAPYQYAFVPSGDPEPTNFGTPNNFDVAGPYPMDYDFYVLDATGCVNFTTVTVTEQLAVFNPTFSVTNQCTAVADYQIRVTSPISTGSGLPEETFMYDIGSGFQASTDFTVPNAGTYLITVRDRNGCIGTVTAEVFDFFAVNASATTLPNCNDTDGEVTVSTTGGSGNFEYQLRLDDGALTPVGAPQNSNVFANVAPGEYSILVTDLSSNTSPLCTDEALVTITTVNNPIIAATPAAGVSCNGANDGTILVQLQPGSDTDTPLVYNLYDGANTTPIAGPQAANLFAGLPPGTYQVEVVSNRGCTDRSADILIDEPSPLTIATGNTSFVCDLSNNEFSTAALTIFTDTNGDGTGTPTGTAPYTYSIDDGTPQFDGTNFQTSNVFDIIDDGTNRTITVTARDLNGCEISTTATIDTPTDITFSFDVTPITCDAASGGTQEGTVTIIVNEGPGNYEVQILPLGSQPSRSSGGSDRVTWDISTAGNYVFAVTDLDNGGCNLLTSVVNLPDLTNVSATIAEARPVTCFDGQDGELSIVIENYSGMYSYEVFSRDNAGVETTTGVTGTFDTNAPNATPEIIVGVPAGNLVVYVQALETPFCSVISNAATVRSPDRALTVALEQTANVTCNVPGLGEITATGDGGWGAYEYQLIAPDGTTLLQDFPNTNAIFRDLSTGVYTVNIRDAMGCIEQNTIDLPLPDPIVANIQIVSPLQCNNDNNAVIEAFDIIGGQGAGNYLFQLNRLSDGSNSGLQVDAQFGNLSSGNYTITIFDGLNCSFTTAPILVQNPEIVSASLVELQPPGCGDVGRMLLTVTNPQAGVDYFYRRTGSTGAFIPFGTGVISIELTADITVDAGPFQFDIQNSNGCPFENSNQISLDPAAPLEITLDLTNATINCSGESTGIIRSEAIGGIGSYMYTLLNSDTPPVPDANNTVRPAQESGIFRDLPVGTYYVYSRSGGCEAISSPITIEARTPLILETADISPVTCNGANDGQIIIEVSGGTGNVRFAISDRLSEFFEGDDATTPNTRTFTNLEPREYIIIIQDDLGCTITEFITIEQPDLLVGAVATTTPETCIGMADGSLQLDIIGGTAPYFIAVNSNDPADFEQNDTLQIDNLQGGEEYEIFVRDSRGCETFVMATVAIGVDLRVTPRVDYGCEGIFPNSTTSILIEDETQLPQLLFSLDTDDISNATEQNIFADLSPGEHTVFVYHANGCSTSTSFSIDAFEPLLLTAEKTSETEITATAMGGFGDYEFFFQGESTGSTNVYEAFEDQSVEVKVVDSQGCEVVILVTFDFDAMPDIPDFFTPDGDVLNDEFKINNPQLFPNLVLVIFDRYGRVVAELKAVEGWDGTYNGNELPTGDYWYVVNANNAEGTQFVGHFTLYR